MTISANIQSERAWGFPSKTLSSRFRWLSCFCTYDTFHFTIRNGHSEQARARCVCVCVCGCVRVCVRALPALRDSALLWRWPWSCGASVRFRITKRYVLAGLASSETLGVISRFWPKNIWCLHQFTSVYIGKSLSLFLWKRHSRGQSRVVRHKMASQHRLDLSSCERCQGERLLGVRCIAFAAVFWLPLFWNPHLFLQRIATPKLQKFSSWAL